jgi:hypothetical protein
VGPRAGLDDVEKRKFLTLPRLELQLLSRPTLSQSLYRLRYPGSPYYLHKDMWEDNIKMDLRETSFEMWHLNRTNLKEQQPKLS